MDEDAKKHGLATSIAPLIDELQSSGMRISSKVRRRILELADE
jgi:predicted nucleic acid-binding protein